MKTEKEIKETIGVMEALVDHIENPSKLGYEMTIAWLKWVIKK